MSRREERGVGRHRECVRATGDSSDFVQSVSRLVNGDATGEQTPPLSAPASRGFASPPEGPPPCVSPRPDLTLHADEISPQCLPLPRVRAGRVRVHRQFGSPCSQMAHPIMDQFWRGSLAAPTGGLHVLVRCLVRTCMSTKSPWRRLPLGGCRQARRGRDGKLGTSTLEQLNR